MLNRKSTLTACGVAILWLAMTASGDAWMNAMRTDYLTFGEPVELPGVVLAAGTYIFELADPNVSLNVVRVLNPGRSRVFLTTFTETIQRPAAWPLDRPVSLGEAPAGVPPRIKVWYPIGDSTGHEFIYRNTVR